MSDWLDLSTGISPHAYPFTQLTADAWTRLPGRQVMDDLLSVARLAYGVPEGADTVAAPGTQALIQWMPRLMPEGAVAIVSPTYSEHALAFTNVGREVIASSRDDPLPPQARHLVLVSPNNPDGHVWPLARIEALAGEVAARGGWMVVDEAFVDTVPEASVARLCATHPLIVLRSFGKFHGLAGLRLGFLIARPALAALFGQALGPWCVSGPALAVGREALADEAWTRAMRRRLAREAAAVDAVLTGASLEIMGGTSLFRLVRHPAAGVIYEQLAAARIWVRRFDHDPLHLRFGLPPDADGRERLARALAALKL